MLTSVRASNLCNSMSSKAVKSELGSHFRADHPLFFFYFNITGLSLYGTKGIPLLTTDKHIQYLRSGKDDQLTGALHTSYSLRRTSPVKPFTASYLTINYL